MPVRPTILPNDAGVATRVTKAVVVSLADT